MTGRSYTSLALISLLPVAAAAYALGCDASYLGAHRSPPGHIDAFDVAWWISWCVFLALVPTALLSMARGGGLLRLRGMRTRACGVVIAIALIAIYGFAAVDAQEAWKEYVGDHYAPDHEGPYRFLFADVQELHHVSWTYVILATLAAAATVFFTAPRREATPA